MANTIEAAKELHSRLNEESVLPIKICLDVGHAPHPTQRDPYLWLEELGEYACSIHLQQTEDGHSRHWPFTPEFNQIGIIEPRKVLSSLEKSGLEEIYLMFEILHRESHEQEPRVIPEIKQSISYWRKQLPSSQEIRLTETSEVGK
jgi:hypothetical protein